MAAKVGDGLAEQMSKKKRQRNGGGGKKATPPKTKPAAAPKLEGDEKHTGITALAVRHQEMLRAEFMRQSDARLRRYDWRAAYETELPLADLMGAEDDWLSRVRINHMRPEVDRIQSEITRRRIHPKISYVGDGHREDMMPLPETMRVQQQQAAAGQMPPEEDDVPDEDDFDRVAELRNLQSRTIINRSSFFREREAAVKDAATTGEGWVMWGVQPSLQEPGKRMVVCKHIPWDSIIIDSLNSTATGDIEKCRFIAHFSLVEKDVFVDRFPKFKDVAESLCMGLQVGRKAPIDPVEFFAGWGYGRQEYSDSDAYEYLIGGQEVAGREFVVYGKMYYREVDGRILSYPFVCDRNVTEMHQLAKAAWAYSHNLYPFLRWVDNLYQDMQPFPSIADGKIGLELMLNYTVRQVLKRLGGRMVKFSDKAVPRGGHGEPSQQLELFREDLSAALDEANPILYTADIKELDVQTSNPEAQQIASFIQVLMGLHGGSGTTQNPHLTGQSGGSTPASGVALMQHRDTMLTGHNLLFSTDHAAIEKLGTMNIYNLRAFEDIASRRAFSDDRGMLARLPRRLLPSAGQLGEVDIGVVAAGDLGVSVEPLEGMGALTPDKVGVLNEMIKGFAATPEINMALLVSLMKKFDFFNDDISMVMDMMIEMGIMLPDKVLSARQKQRKREKMTDKQRQEKPMIEMEFKQAEANLNKTLSEGRRNMGQAAKAFSDADAGALAAARDSSVAAGGGEGAPAAGAGAGEGADGDLAAVLAENERLKQQNAELEAQIGGAAAGQ